MLEFIWVTPINACHAVKYINSKGSVISEMDFYSMPLGEKLTVKN